MKFYSEITKKVYDSVEELDTAEAKVKEEQKKDEEKKAMRAERAKEVENAFKDVQEAQKKANKLLSEFTKDYGSFHMSCKSDFPMTSLLDFMLSKF